MLEYTLELPEPLHEDIGALLLAAGAEGCWSDGNLLRIYATAEAFERTANSVLAAFEKKLPPGHPLPDTNWNATWEAQVKPFTVGNSLEVLAAHHVPSGTAELSLRLPRLGAFGTGHHPTTELLVREVLAHLLEGLAVADLGCGLGLLGLVAAHKGAKRVWFLDNNPVALDVTRENVAANYPPAAQLFFTTGTPATPPPFLAQVAFANINRNVHVAYAQAYAKLLVPNGLLWLSGVYANDTAPVSEALQQAGFHCEAEKTQQEWWASAWRHKA